MPLRDREDAHLFQPEDGVLDQIDGRPAEQVIAACDDGATGVSPIVPVIVNNPPSVAMTGPANGTPFIGPTNVTLTATASDLDGTVVRVKFFQGTNEIGEDLSAPYSLTLSNVLLRLAIFFHLAWWQQLCHSCRSCLPSMGWMSKLYIVEVGI